MTFASNRGHQQSRSSSDVAGCVPLYEADNVVLSSAAENLRLTSVSVSGNLLPLLCVTPLLGRPFTEEESNGTGPRAVVLDHLT